MLKPSAREPVTRGRTATCAVSFRTSRDASRRATRWRSSGQHAGAAEILRNVAVRVVVANTHELHQVSDHKAVARSPQRHRAKAPLVAVH